MARIKCSRCDRHYSGMRLKCPYCGAHRSKKTVRKEQEEMSNSKFLIGGIILIALIVAVAILIIISASGSKPADKAENNNQNDQLYSQDDGVLSVDGTITNNDSNTDGSQPDDNKDSENDPAEPVINSVSIVRNGEVKTDVTFYIGDTYGYSYETDPADADETAVWSSDNEDVAVVLQNGEVTALSEGIANITVTVGGKSASMIVRVNG